MEGPISIVVCIKYRNMGRSRGLRGPKTLLLILSVASLSLSLKYDDREGEI
jgi:hypothetical protein